MSRGIARERAWRKRLEADGWIVTRGAGSLGAADLVALKAGHVPRLDQVKSDERSPWAHFGPADRAELLRVASLAGAVPRLVWWPPRRQPVVLLQDEWPPGPAESNW